MNYICEDNINFYDLINDDNQDNTEENENNDNCLISNLPLDNTCIELPCKHKYNYYYLYQDIYNQKKSFNPYKGYEYRTNSNTIICPYCRTHINYLLPPTLDINNVKSKLSINAPKRFCLKLKCNIDNYKNKEDIISNIEPCIDDLVYVTPYGNYCLMHYKVIKYSKKRKERIKNKNINKVEYPIAELSKYERKYKLDELREICKNNNIDISGTKKDMIIRLYNSNIVI